MPRIVLRAGADPERIIDLRRSSTAGTAPTDDIHLPGGGDAALTLAPAPGGVLIEARQALTVAGRLLSPGVRRLLRRGDRAEADGWSLSIDPSDAEEDATRTLLGAALAGVATAPANGPGVLVLEGPSAGERHALATGTTIGRGPDADVRVPDPLASRRHVQVEIRRGAACARDLGSKNGVTVRTREGEEVRERHVQDGRVRLRSGDEIEVGTTLLLYEDIVAAPPGPGRNGARWRGAIHHVAVAVASLALLGAAAWLAGAAN